MAKAINWPLPFRDEILREGTEQLFSAFRIGTVYYDGHYWVDGEEVDIRCNQRRIRRGIVVGDLKACAIKDLSEVDIQRQKTPLKDRQKIVDYLAAAYDQPVDFDTVVTVVTYRNLPVVPENVELEPDHSERNV